MKIAIYGKAMPFEHQQIEALGGSETAQWQLGLELASRGHSVYQMRETDHPYMMHVEWGKGEIFYGHYSTKLERMDAAIIQRATTLRYNVRADGHFLWMQDFSLPHYPHTYGFREVWCVSEWAKRQFMAMHPYNKVHVEVIRNGIVRHNLIPPGDDKDPHSLVYAQRPERGLWSIIRPGGILDRLPEPYYLSVCGYDRVGPSDWHDLLEKTMREHPRVDWLGKQSNHQVRELLSGAAAVLMPTNYAETSCMTAREAIEQQCVVFYTPVAVDPAATYGSGAVPETLDNCGVEIGPVSDAWSPCVYETDSAAEDWAECIEETLTDSTWMRNLSRCMKLRTDLYWPEVADHMLRRMQA